MPYLRVKAGRPIKDKVIDGHVEGFIPDLLAALSSELGFKYQTQFVKDGRYGYCGPDKNDPNQTVCNGMVQEVINGVSYAVFLK